MKKMMLLTLMVLVLISVAALAEAPRWGRRPSPEKMIEKMSKELGLTKEQQDKYLDEAKKIEKEAEESNAKNKEIFDKIEQELLKDSPDKQAIRGYMDQISQNRTGIQFKRMEQMIELKKELTAEQRKKFEEFMYNRKKKERHS